MGENVTSTTPIGYKARFLRFQGFVSCWQLALANGKSLNFGQLIAGTFCAKEYGICWLCKSKGRINLK
jgi:hypothetical protein